jgi:hypothetical protein
MKSENKRVVDMCAKIDFSSYVRPDYDWNFIVATDSAKPPAPVSFQTALEEYCNLQSSFKVCVARSTTSHYIDHSMKEITLQKQLNWNIAAFETAVNTLLRTHPSWRYSGHFYTFTAKFRYENQLVTARSPSKWSTFSHNGFVRFFCVISCLVTKAIDPVYTVSHSSL